MPEESKPERADEETSASTDVEETPKAKEFDPRASIYEKYDAMKAAKVAEEAGEAPDEETTEEAPPEKASATEEKPKTVKAEEPETEELTAEEFAERFKHVKVKGKFAGEDAVVSAKDLLRVQGLDRHLTKRLQEVARKEESLGAAPPLTTEYRPAEDTSTEATNKPLRYWKEDEVARKYDELFSESPFKANTFLSAVQSDRSIAQAENEKVRMDTAEKDFLALHPELGKDDYESMKKSFSDPEFFRKNADVDHAFQRRDYYGALELARVKMVEKRLNEKLASIKVAQDAALAEEARKTELKKKGSVIRTSSKPEVKPIEEFKELSPSETIAAEAARRRALMNR